MYLRETVRQRCFTVYGRKYDDDCFEDQQKSGNEQYERMPDTFKGHIATYESVAICLRPATESSGMIRTFSDPAENIKPH